jgi:WD40 repeat protein
MKRIGAVALIGTMLFCGGTATAQTAKKSRSAAKPPAKSAAKTPAAPKLPPLRKPVHPGPMWSVAFSPDGTRLAVGGYRKIFLYDAATGAKAAEYPVSSDAVRSLAFSPDGVLIAAGTGVPGQSGGTILVEAATGKTVRTLKSHTDTVEAVAFSGNLLLSAADDERIAVTDVTTGQELGKLSEHIGRCLAVAVPKETTPADGGEIFATGGADNMVKVWDAKARRVVVNFDQCQSTVWCLAAMPRGGTFIAGSGDGKIRTFRVRMDGNKGGVAEGIPARTGTLARQTDGHEGGVYALAVSPDGRYMISGGADKKVLLWRDGNKYKELTEAGSDIWGVAVSPDGKRAAAASLDGRTRVYDVEKGVLLLTLDGNGIVVPPAAEPVPTTSPANPNRL